jgi:arabinofuranosyltransferase
VMVFALVAGEKKGKLVQIAKLTGGFAFGFAAYLAFNLWLSGSLWPNTFYAKQAEYAAQLQFPLMERIGGLLSQVMVGGGVLLLPGFIFLLWQGLRQRNWIVLASAAWWLGYAVLYALRLPVIYQHGRYMMPAMPVYLVLGAAGTAILLAKLANRAAWQKLLRFGWLTGMALLWLVFTIVGAATYAGDVAIIESEMVATGRWIAANTPPDALIAVHDIGAVGYFGQRRLVDLAGLVSPEVIPYIRDETWLDIYLNERAVDYLVTFPNWYERLALRREVVYTTNGRFAPAAGGENMVVYRWP